MTATTEGTVGVGGARDGARWVMLSQAAGVAVFGSVFLTLDRGSGAGVGGISVISGHAVFVTLAWIAATLALGVVTAVPLVRTVRAAAAPVGR